MGTATASTATETGTAMSRGATGIVTETTVTEMSASATGIGIGRDTDAGGTILSVLLATTTAEESTVEGTMMPAMVVVEGGTMTNEGGVANIARG